MYWLRNLAESPQPVDRHHLLQAMAIYGLRVSYGLADVVRRTYGTLITSRGPSRVFDEQPAVNFASKVFTKLRISAACPCISRN